MIRRKVLIDGFRQRDAAEALGHSRKTIAQALALRLPAGYRRSEPRPHPVLEPVQRIIDAWREQNGKARPQQRQTAQKIYERLREEYGFTGHYGTVPRYVKEATPRQKEVFLPLELEPGEEAQVDWQEGWIFENGVERQGQVVAVHERCDRPGQFVLDPRHYLKLLERKPGSLDNARPCQGQPWGESFDLLRKELEYRYPRDGTLRYIQVLLLFTQYPPEQVQAAVDLCVRRRAFSEDAVLNALRHEPLSPRKQLDLSDRPELITQDSGVRDVGIYDQRKSREAGRVGAANDSSWTAISRRSSCRPCGPSTRPSPANAVRRMLPTRTSCNRWRSWKCSDERPWRSSVGSSRRSSRWSRSFRRTGLPTFRN